MGVIIWRELFPGRWSAVIFIAYMALFVNQGIIVTWSQTKGHYKYNIVTVVLLTEILKLALSTLLYLWNNETSTLLREMARNKQVFMLYFAPAFLYCFYNNLAFVNLAVFDPTTYYLLLQFRVVVTGIIFQVVFRKQLSGKQWISLIVLTIGCMMKHVDFSAGHLGNVDLNLNLILVFIQIICSCLAGVYNEYLLKGEGANVDIYIQNIFMYIDSIICNLAVLVFEGKSGEAFENVVPEILLNPKVLLIIFNNAAVGIITSFFLKNLNSILKTFASALELVFTAILCWIFFGIPIYLNTIIAISMVSYAVVIYSQNPVQNVQPKIVDFKINGMDRDDEQLLLEREAEMV